MTVHLFEKDAELARIMRARSRLSAKAPGYSAIVFGLELVETTRTETMATDGRCIYWNREFVRSIPDREIVGTLFHEGLHVTLCHHLRRGGIDPDLWNVACDYVINLIVFDAGEKLPEGALFDRQYRGMTANQVAKLLTPPSTDDGDEGEDEGEGEGEGEGEEGGFPGQPCDFGNAGEIWDATNKEGEALSPAERNVREEETRRDVIVAGTIEKVAGSGSITIDSGILDAAKAANVDWVEALADFLDKSFGQEETMAKPNRRFIGGGSYFPSTKGVGGGDLVIAIDTSGSVSQQEAQRFATEIDGIRQTIQPNRTCVIYCDDYIQKGKNGQLYDDFDSFEDIEVRAIDGGGTRFDPPFHLVEQEGLQPNAFLYFTDGYCHVEERTGSLVDYPVLWVTTGAEPSFRGEPFGDVLEVDI
jgi:predicted metal-dependent peptidase